MAFKVSFFTVFWPTTSLAAIFLVTFTVAAELSDAALQAPQKKLVMASKIFFQCLYIIMYISLLCYIKYI